MVAAVAASLAMFANERESVYAIVVEGPLTPVRAGVAIVAGCPQLAAVYVLTVVAGCAIGGRVLVAIARVAERTVGCGMSVC